MNFVHISDTHFRHQPMESHPVFPAEKIVDREGKRLRQTLRRALSQSQKPDFFVFTGDLVHESTAKDYRMLAELLAEELGETPYYMALGNHDRHAAYWEGFWGKPGKDAPYYDVFFQEGLRVIVLDSSPQDGCATGKMDAQQLAWLKEELKTPASKGTIILMHHPMELVYSAGHGKDDGHALNLAEGAGELQRLLKRSDVVAVLSGHTHFPSIHADGGILYATAAGTAFGLDPADQNRMVFQDTASYYTGRVEDGKVFMGLVNMPFPGDTIFAFDLSALMEQMTESA